MLHRARATASVAMESDLVQMRHPVIAASILIVVSHPVLRIKSIHQHANLRF